MNNEALNRRQYLILTAFASVYILIGFVFTLQAPFYPTEAQKKGATAAEYGIVLGAYQVVVFITSPVMAYAIPHVGSKNLYYSGIFTLGATTVMFGFLYKIDNLTIFLSASILLRIFEGAGFSATYVAMYSFVPTVFPNHISLVTGILEMSNVFAFAIGPAIGGLLYSLGGFVLPFSVVGMGTLASLLVVVPAVWSMTFSDTSNAPGRGVLALFKIPAVSINFFVIFFHSMFMAFVYNNLAEYLRLQFSFTAFYVGLVFSAFGLFTAVLSPVWGYWMGKVSGHFYFIYFGVVLGFLGLLLIGPVPYLGLQANLSTTLVGISTFAIGDGLVLIAAYVNAPIEAKHHGFPNDGTTSALVFGCGMGSYSLGGGIGAPISGFLKDRVGFRIAELFVAGTSLFLIFVLSIYHIRSRCDMKNMPETLDCSQSESSSLLLDQDNMKLWNSQKQQRIPSYVISGK